jgi:DNA-binding transcriptional regulator LsrR (DeoR family)
MAAKGAVGVIIGRFIDAEGRQVRDAIDERTVGITLEQLKCASIRICAAGGPRKTEALRAGLLGGYATHLVTDMKTARMLLE